MQHCIAQSVTKRLNKKMSPNFVVIMKQTNDHKYCFRRFGGGMGGEEKGRRYDQSAMQYNASCVYMEDNPFKYWVPQHTSSEHLQFFFFFICMCMCFMLSDISFILWLKNVGIFWKKLYFFLIAVITLQSATRAFLCRSKTTYLVILKFLPCTFSSLFYD